MPCGYFGQQQLVAAGADEIIHVAGLGHAHRRMDQQIRLNLLGGAHRQFDVSAMHRVAGLERDDLGPAHALKFRANVLRSQTQFAEIVVRGFLQSFDFSADVPRIRLVDGVVGARMRGAGRAKYSFGFGRAIGLPHVFDVQHREHHAFGIAQRNLAGPGGELLGKLFGDVECDRHRPQRAVGQAHVLQTPS